MRVSPQTRALFAEFCSACVPRTKVDRLFRAEGFLPATSSANGTSIADQFQEGIDWSDGHSVVRALRVYQATIDACGRPRGTSLSPKAAAVTASCRRDGLEVSADGCIEIPHALEPDVRLDFNRFSRLSPAEREALARHLVRVESGLSCDPAAAISSSKELLESVFRIILDEETGPSSRRDTVPALYKRVSEVLQLKVSAVPNDRASAESVHRALQSLSSTVQALCELRNQIGLGHGRAVSSPAQRRHGQLAFDAAQTVSSFLLTSWDGAATP